MSFETYDLHPPIAQAIERLKFTEPTPIQKGALPPALAGRDVLGLAPTGTGKTAAFALPILQRLSDGPRRHVRALIVAPTRELAEQICDVFRELGRGTKLHTTAIYGGVGMGGQISALRAGSEIVVACPGRLLDHLDHGTIDLSKVEVLVLDEADRMLDMGFLPPIRRILRKLPTKRQTLFFSATMPDDVRKLSSEMLSNPETVEIGHTAPVATVSHALYPVSPGRKTALLMRLLEETKTESVIVFTRTKHRAKRLARQLETTGRTVTSLQGNLSQNARRAALDGFRNGRFQVLVATDIAARGVDVEQISHVINYDIPDTTDAYTHRIGRTGRAARTGEAFTLVTGEDGPTIRAIERVLGEKIERRHFEGFEDDGSTPEPTPLPRPRSFRRDSRPAPTVARVRSRRGGGTSAAS